jgi:quercetin dioxygenase-like cupin family protein
MRIAGTPRQSRRPEKPTLATTAASRHLALDSAPADAIEHRLMQTWDVRTLPVEAHHPQVLRSDDETRAIVIHLPRGEELQEHQVHERAYVLVVDGEVEIDQGDHTVSGSCGLLAHFEPNERRTIRALSDARLVLVLAPWPGVGHPSQSRS